MEKKFVLSIDQSTSSTKLFIIDSEGQVLADYALSHKTYYPKPGWVEHDPVEIFDNTLKAIFHILKENNLSQKDIAVLAITNQRETTVVWDKVSGQPVCNAIVWQCARTSEICDSLNKEGYGDVVKDKTGYMIVPSPPGSKLKWILGNIPGAREKMNQGRLLFGQIDSWLLWKLTGGLVHATDYSNASRSILFDIDKLEWDDQLLSMFDADRSMLPEVKASDEIFGYTSKKLGFELEIPISGIMGDSHAALFGHQCIKQGMAKATYGTGSSIMMNIGNEVQQSSHGLVTSIGWLMKNEVVYVLEGNINFAGSTIQWLKDDLEMIKSSHETDQLASSVTSTEGVYIVPAFNGLSAPHWDNHARAAISGMNRATKKTHIVRAALESIAYQVKDILDIMSDQAKVQLNELRVDGGPTNNNFLMQFQSDVAGVPIAVSNVLDASAYGSALMAGIGVGFWKDKEAISHLYSSTSSFKQTMDKNTVNQLYAGWQDAVKRVLTKK